MYTIVSDHPDGRPSPLVPSKIVAENLAKMMEKITGHKYKVVPPDEKTEEPKIIDVEIHRDRLVKQAKPGRGKLAKGYDPITKKWTD